MPLKLAYMTPLLPAAEHTHDSIAQMPFVPLSRNWLAHQLARTPIQRSGGQLLADVTPPYFAVVTHEGRPNCPHYSRSQYAPELGDGDEQCLKRRERRQNLKEWRSGMLRYKIFNSDESVWIVWAHDKPLAYSLDEVLSIFYTGNFSRNDRLNNADHVALSQGRPDREGVLPHTNLRASFAGVPGAPLGLEGHEAWLAYTNRSDLIVSEALRVMETYRRTIVREPVAAQVQPQEAPQQ